MSQARCQLFRAFYFDNITPLMQACVSGNVDLMDIQKLTHACRAHGMTRMERKIDRWLARDRERKRDRFLQHDTQTPAYRLTCNFITPKYFSPVNIQTWQTFSPLWRHTVINKVTAPVSELETTTTCCEGTIVHCVFFLWYWIVVTWITSVFIWYGSGLKAHRGKKRLWFKFPQN